MWHGFLCEYVSVPKALKDEFEHPHPKSAVEFARWRELGGYRPQAADYKEDDAALKLISQSEWERDRPLYDYKNPQLAAKDGERRDFFVRAQRTWNYVRRMVPHVLGWFPITTAWVIIVNHLYHAIYDVKLISDRNIPGWVEALVWGQIIIFYSFALVSSTHSNIYTRTSTLEPTGIFVLVVWWHHSTPNTNRGRSKSSSSACLPDFTLAPSSPTPSCHS